MHLTDQVMAETKVFVDFINNYPSGTPVVMVNILKFKDKSGKADESGQETYNNYSKNVAPLLAKVGGKLIWAGKVNKTIIGDQMTQPDSILIVSYPSKEAFIEMATSEEYKVVGQDRAISLEYGGLLATQTLA